MAKISVKTEVKNETKTVVKGKVETPKTLIEKLIGLDATADALYVDYARTLYAAKKADAHVSAGFADDLNGFVAFCDEKLSIGYRKAQYYIKIWENALEHNLKVADLEVIGWSKMKEVVAVMTPDNVDNLMEAAKTKSHRELLAYIASLKGTKSGATSTVSGTSGSTVKFTFLVAEEDNDTVNAAITEAKQRMNSTNPAEALITICQDWLALGGAALPNTFEDYVALIEKQFSIIVAPVSGGERVNPGKVTEMQIPKTTRAAATAPTTTAAPKTGKTKKEEPVVESVKVPPFDESVLYTMDIAGLKEFATTNGKTIPTTVKGKVAIRDFLVKAMLTDPTEALVVDTPVAVDPSIIDPATDVLEPEVQGEAAPGEDDKEVDPETAPHDVLMKIATHYGIEIPKAMQPKKHVETLRTHLLKTLKDMGLVEEEKVDALPEDDTVAAEEMLGSYEEVKDDLKAAMLWVKESGLLEEIKAHREAEKKPKLGNKITTDDLYAEVVGAIERKFNITFDSGAEEGDESLL